VLLKKKAERMPIIIRRVTGSLGIRGEVVGDEKDQDANKGGDAGHGNAERFAMP
jgi:hypothetical protein